MPTTITIPQGNTLSQTIRAAYADGGGFSPGDYAVIKIRNAVNAVLWAGVFDLGELYDEAEGAALIDWELTADESAAIRPGAYNWDITIHLGAELYRGFPVNAAEVITPENTRLSKFNVERVVSNGGRN